MFRMSFHISRSRNNSRLAVFTLIGLDIWLQFCAIRYSSNQYLPVLFLLYSSVVLKQTSFSTNGNASDFCAEDEPFECGVGMRWGWIHFVRWPLIGLLYQPQMTDEYGLYGGMRIDRGIRGTRRKTAPVVTLSTTNPAWLDVGLKLARRGGKPATNRSTCCPDGWPVPPDKFHGPWIPHFFSSLYIKELYCDVYTYW
jgi:hypothetical protein